MSDQVPGAPPVTALAAVTLRAAAFAVSGSPHPNKMPFSGVLTFLDEPSDAAPEGAGGRRVMITAKAAEDALDTLVGMAIDCEADFSGHAPQNKIGVISGARIAPQGSRQAIVVDGYIFAADFPDLAAEIKANKSALGMSFEARDLWTPDPKANPVAITNCVFTGAAILFKDKASYRSTSISAAATAAHSEDKGLTMPLDTETKDALSAMFAEAIKPVTDLVAAQGEKIAALEKMPEQFAKVQAANHLDKIEPHAKRLEDAASKMEDAGLGGHPSMGHVAVLRKMAGAMRADAAEGKMPHVFDRYMAAAEKTEDKDAAVAAVKADADKVLTEVKAAADKTETDLKAKLAEAESKITALEAKAAEAAKTAERPARETLAPGVVPLGLSNGQVRLMAKAGIEMPAEGKKLALNDLNKAFSAAGLSTDQRFELKTALARQGLIAE